MILFPAIDILNGECVRLKYGDYAQVTHYGSPTERAIMWEKAGAEYLHVVDLDAAKSGKAENIDCIREIVANVKIPLQTGGGVRTLADAEARLSAGASRVILGTACCENPDTVRMAVAAFGSERIVCGIDAKDGFVATRGWLNKTEISPIALGNEMYSMGVRYVVYTDISRDGALSGVNCDACVQMAKMTSLNVIASGGVSGLDDVTVLKNSNMYGAILGKALYENKISLPEALKAVKSED